MLEEDAVAGTEVVESGLAVGCMKEAQAWTFSMTGLEPQAFAALTWQSLFLKPAEMVLLGAIEHLRQAILAYVA